MKAMKTTMKRMLDMLADTLADTLAARLADTLAAECELVLDADDAECELVLDADAIDRDADFAQVEKFRSRAHRELQLTPVAPHLRPLLAGELDSRIDAATPSILASESVSQAIDGLDRRLRAELAVYVR